MNMPSIPIANITFKKKSQTSFYMCYFDAFMKMYLTIANIDTPLKNCFTTKKKDEKYSKLKFGM